VGGDALGRGAWDWESCETLDFDTYGTSGAVMVCISAN
jgi:hypothetical protein